MYQPSFRAQVITRRTYNRPLNDEGTVFETWEQTIDRVIEHQTWLWKRAQSRALNKSQQTELDELRQLLLDRKVGVAGRTLWLGGTSLSKRREASNFNCAFTHLETVHDFVDLLWLLLQGCGVGFKAVTGTLNGFAVPINDVEVVPSAITLEMWEAGHRGREHNVETWDAETGVWTISVGDSAEAWAKAVGKILAGKRPAKKLILDFSNVRPAGVRLKGYGWISAGYEPLARAMVAIVKIMTQRAAQLLRKMDIHDLANWCGTVLSTRRSAEISLFEYDSPEWREFAVCKRNMYEKGQPQREQSNNSLVFYSRPTKEALAEIFQMMLDSGGSEPGFINGEEALRRAPWFSGMNPCAEILLPNKGFCNLTTVDVAKFKDDPSGLSRAVYLIARANYRQTCVDLRDGVLQEAWHQNNEFLRLCGVSQTGQVRRDDLGPYEKRVLRNIAVQGAYSMADELGTPRPKNVTTVKPEGTGSKIMDTTEGIHRPSSRYIFNNVAFGEHDPLVPLLRANGYKVTPHPTRPSDVIVALPVAWEDVDFDMVNGLHVNLEPAVSQLNRYKEMMVNYVDQNCSITVSYDPEEVPAIIDWIHANWDHYVGVSFLLREDPTKTAADLGYLYLPQEAVTKEVYDAYVAGLTPFDIDQANSLDEFEQEECATGGCPIR